MELRELKALVQVAATGSLHASAAVLHVTPAAVHKQMKALERSIGLPLYTKQGTSLRLNQVAEILLPYARALVAQHQAACEALEQYKGVRRGMVRLGAGPTMSSYVMPRILKRFRTTFPKIELMVDTGSSAVLLDRLRRGEIDLAFLVGERSEGPDLHEYVRWQFDMVLVTAMRRGGRRPVRLRDLSKTPIVLFQQATRIQRIIDAWFEEHRFEPRASMHLDNADAIKAMVKAGLGTAILPYWAVASDIESGELTALELAEPLPSGHISLLRAARLYTPASVQGFLDLVAELPKQSLHLTPVRHVK